MKKILIAIIALPFYIFVGFFVCIGKVLEGIYNTLKLWKETFIDMEYIKEDDFKCPNAIECKTICNIGYACDGCPYNKEKKGEKNGDT